MRKAETFSIFFHLLIFKTVAKSNLSDNDSSKRPSPLRLLLIGVLLFVFISIALQTCGVNIMSRSKEEKLIDKPHSPERQEREVPKDLEVD